MSTPNSSDLRSSFLRSLRYSLRTPEHARRTYPISVRVAYYISLLSAMLLIAWSILR